MMKNFWISLLMAALFLGILPTPAAHAAGTAVQVILPTHTVTLNGQTFSSDYSRYPFLVYKDITFLPLTWRFAVEEFGWDYKFDGDTGLVISNPNAALTSEEEPNASVSDYSGLMGTGNMKLPCIFGVSQEEDQRNVHISLYNVVGNDIHILEDGFQWEYQIYQIIGGKEELVYRKAIPFFAGELPAGHFASMSFPDSYWNEHTPDGDYRFVLVHPEEYRYQILGEEQVCTEPAEGDGYRVTFSTRL